MAKEMQPEATAVSRKSGVARKKKKAIRLPINWFDIVVILLIVAVAALVLGGTQLRDLFGIGAQEERCTVEYMVTFSDVDQDLALSVREGDAVYGSTASSFMGEVITDPEVQAHRVVSYTHGTAQMKEKPGAVDVTVTVRAEAIYQEGVGYTIGDTTVRVGDTLSLRFPGYVGVGSCINISRSSD